MEGSQNLDSEARIHLGRIRKPLRERGIDSRCGTTNDSELAAARVDFAAEEEEDSVVAAAIAAAAVEAGRPLAS